MNFERSTVLPARVSRVCSVPNVGTGWKHRATCVSCMCSVPNVYTGWKRRATFLVRALQKKGVRGLPFYFLKKIYFPNYQLIITRILYQIRVRRKLNGRNRTKHCRRWALWFIRPRLKEFAEANQVLSSVTFPV